MSLQLLMRRNRQSELAKRIEEGRATSAERYEFRTLGEGDTVYNQLLMALVILKIARMPKGMELLKTLGKELIKGAFDSLHALGQASAGNKVSSWANPYLVSLVLERFGFVARERMLEYRVGLSLISGAEVAEGFVDTIAQIVPWGKPEPSEYPTHLVFSAREAGIELPEKMTYRELIDLMRTYRVPKAPKKKKGK